MNRTKVANELVKIAKELVADVSDVKEYMAEIMEKMKDASNAIKVAIKDVDRLVQKSRSKDVKRNWLNAKSYVYDGLKGDNSFRPEAKNIRKLERAVTFVKDILGDLGNPSDPTWKALMNIVGEINYVVDNQREYDKAEKRMLG